MRPDATDASAQQNLAGSVLSRKIQKVLAIRSDSANCKEAMIKVSHFFEENSVHARRHLRSSVEHESYKLHEKFVADFNSVEETVSQLDTLVADLENALTVATKHLEESKTKTQSVLEKAAELRAQRSLACEKQKILKCFLAKFQIPEEHLQIVKSSDYPINDEFFTAVAKVEEIRQNARSMLNLMAHQGAPTAGLDILRETSNTLETAFERLFLWVQKQCRPPRQSGRISSTWMREEEMGIFFRAMRLLQQRPVYFNHCVANVARLRRQMLVQQFLSICSQGNPSQGVRPIEAHAYDPLRYCGDMLAWIHEHVARERDQLAPCLGSVTKSTSLDLNVTSVQSEEVKLESCDSVVDSILDGLVQPFKSRVEAVLRSAGPALGSSSVSFYRLSQLFHHFAQSLTQFVEARDVPRSSFSRSTLNTAPYGPHEDESKSIFVNTLQDLSRRAFQAFLDMCDTQAQKFREKDTAQLQFTLGPLDLSTPSFVMETVKMLEEVLEIYQNSLTIESPEEREAHIHPILGATFDPLLNHCRQHAASLPDPLDRGVFAINCVSAMREPLTKYSFTADRLTMYVSLLDDEVTALITSQSQLALSQLGLKDLIEEIKAQQIDRDRLTHVLKSFYTSLFTLKTLALPQMDRIAAQVIRAEVRRGVSTVISNAYTELYELLDANNLHGVATHTPEQVKVLLE